MAATLKIGVACLLIMQVSAASNFPDMIRNCRLNHLERLNECLVSGIMGLRPQIAKGIPELDLPQMDPHSLKPIEFAQSEGPVQVRALYDQLIIHGVAGFDLKYFDWHFKQRKLFLGMVFPTLLIKGRYNITGRLFALPIEGNGAYTSLLKGVIVESESNLGVREDGKMYMIDFKLDFKIQDSQSKLDNLFSGNRVLSDTMHHFLKENDELIMNEVRPFLRKQFGDLLGAVIKALFNALPREVMTELESASTNDVHRKRTNEIQAAQKQAQNQG